MTEDEYTLLRDQAVTLEDEAKLLKLHIDDCDIQERETQHLDDRYIEMLAQLADMHRQLADFCEAQ